MVVEPVISPVSLGLIRLSPVRRDFLHRLQSVRTESMLGSWLSFVGQEGGIEGGSD